MRTFKALHKYYVNCFNDEDKFDRVKVIESGLIDKVYDTEFRVSMLEKIYEMVLDTPIVKDISLKYIKNSNMSVDEAIRQWNYENNTDVNINTGHTHVSYCSDRVNSIFSEIEYSGKKISIIDWLLEQKNFMGVASSSKKMEIRSKFVSQFRVYTDIYGMTAEYNKKDMLLKIPLYDKINSITDEEFEGFIDIIRPYSKYIKDTAQNVINSMEREVGYFRFLFSKYSILSDIDRERKNEILALLGKSVTYEINTTDENSQILEDFNNKRKDYKELIDYEFSEEDIMTFNNISSGNEYLSRDEILDMVIQSIIKNKLVKKI